MKEIFERFSFAAFARSLQLPQDYAKGNTNLVVQGREYVCIENFKGISDCTQEQIRLIVSKGKITISGKRLKIICYTKDEIEITGYISKVEYSDT